MADFGQTRGGLPSTILNVPNLLTLARALALPVIVVLFRSGHCVAAALVFVVAMLGDCFDGMIARRFNQRSTLGLYLDPVVDKIVILALFYELARVGLIAWAVAHLFLARELLQSAVRDTAAALGQIVGANWMGKAKATLQTILIAWGLLAPALADIAAAGLARALHGALAPCAWGVLAVSWVFLAVFLYWNRRLFRG